MPIAVCSLITGGAQTIQPKTYTIVRFPFLAESYDPLGMHTPDSPPNASSITASDPAAGLIWPAHDAWGTLTAMMQWRDLDEYSSSNRPTHFRHRFVRDPLNLSTGYDSTATSDHLPRPAGKGRTCKTKTWSIFVHPGTPLGYLVYHDAPVPYVLELAELKLSYWYDA